MSENIKVRWLVDNEQTKIAPKTLSTQILNEDGTYFKDTVAASIAEIDGKIVAHSDNSDIHVTAEEKDNYATKEYVEALYKNLGSTKALAFYCIEDVTIVTNGISKVYPANSNVEVTFAENDTFEIITTSDNSILSLNAFPGALGTYYPWLEGVKQFSNILFDMNNEDMYSKWSQGNQGAYQVQFAQYTNCIFWSDNPYISDVARRTNYTLCSTSELPLCYSTIPDNTFKSFYLAFGVNSDPNWSNSLYKESFAKANWATQVFSYYGARMVGFPGHDSSAFTITLPKDCRGLMFDARNIECAGTFDAVNVTNFGAKSGSWREAFGDCISLRRLYIKNLKVNLNISWSPVDYDSISYIISTAANATAITISVSPYTYNLLSQADFDLAASKNITIALLTTNYVEDRRLSAIDNKADKNVVESTYETKANVQVKIDETKEYIDDQISAIPTPDVSGQISTHNTDTNAHSDIRGDIATLESNINSKLDGKSDTSHSHNDVYYTETEIDALLLNKSDTSHKHDDDYDAKGTSNTAVSTHNTAVDAHNDIRVLINDLTTKLNNFLDVDEDTTDQLSEVLTLIDNNKGTLESLTTSKVNVADIIDNLTTASADKVLSANQGVAIKVLIDALQTELDTKATKENLNSHTSNSNIHITADERAAWNLIENNAKTYTDNKIAAIPTPDVSGQINAHNEDEAAHVDIRATIDTLSEEIDARDNVLVVNLTTDSSYEYAIDKTLDEIAAAKDTGKIIVGRDVGDGSTWLCTYANNYEAIFEKYVAQDNSIRTYQFVIMSDEIELILNSTLDREYVLSKISTHDSDEEAHSDIRNTIANIRDVNSIIKTHTEIISDSTVILNGDEKLTVDISNITGIAGDGFIRVADIPNWINPSREEPEVTIGIHTESVDGGSMDESCSSWSTFGKKDDETITVNGIPIVMGLGYALFVFEDNAEINYNTDSIDFDGIILPKSGIYLRSISFYNSKLMDEFDHVSHRYFFELYNMGNLTYTTEEIKEEYLPDNIATTTYVDEVAANIGGSTVTIKTWTAADMV